MRKTAVQKQWDKLIKQENAFLRNASRKKESKIDVFILEKVPDKLQNTLNRAFAKSFLLVFDKGTGVIEKSYDKEEEILKHQVNRYAYSLKPDKKRLRQFEKASSKVQMKNVTISGVKGVGLGLLGIGLPDIPLFIGVVLKGVYEIALQYGYTYETEEEQYFILNIIAGALSDEVYVIEVNREIDGFITTESLPMYYNRDEQIEKVAEILATELLCMKFLQGLPLVGVIGGVADAAFTHRILAYAKLKYKHRFLYQQMK